jgi:hypothetical protein
MSPQRLPWLNLPIGKLKVLHDFFGDGILLVVVECATQTTDTRKPLP